MCLQVLKRDGREEKYNSNKIIEVCMKAGASYLTGERVAGIVTEYVDKLDRVVESSELKDYIQTTLAIFDRTASISYSNYKKAGERELIDRKILNIINGTNESVNAENANKNPKALNTARDYIAGETNRYLAEKYIYPADLWKMHQKGIIHISDTDFGAEKHRTNCCLVNLEDMLQNGTAINGTRIDKPKTFSTACTIATQIMLAVSASQYGGQTISIAHLVPFVGETRKYFANLGFEKEDLDTLVYTDVKKGVQTLQYQVITLATTNGQAPFVTFYMNMAELPEDLWEDGSLVFYEIIKQRYEGVKNREGQIINPAFPKLIYALDEMNMENGPYWWLTQHAAKCSAKRLVPDYMSNKIQREWKQGDVYPVMGR